VTEGIFAVLYVSIMGLTRFYKMIIFLHLFNTWPLVSWSSLTPAWHSGHTTSPQAAINTCWRRVKIQDEDAFTLNPKGTSTHTTLSIYNITVTLCTS